MANKNKRDRSTSALPATKKTKQVDGKVEKKFVKTTEKKVEKPIEKKVEKVVEQKVEKAPQKKIQKVSVNKNDKPADKKEKKTTDAAQKKDSALPDAPNGFSIDFDPYLMEEADYLKQETKWKNKQRTLIFASRGIAPRYRHLMDDFKKLMPHHKSESKWEKSQSLLEINELCEMKSCNNAIFFECRKHRELYMWVARSPTGPSIKFQVLNVHTMSELKMHGNCLSGSRPLLVFDKPFDELPHLKITKELFIQAFGTPRYHPGSKPFFDHVMSFIIHDDKIWIRHYQISPDTPSDANKVENQNLTEIGPRMVLEYIKIFDGSFGGETLYHNESYMTPAQVRSSMASKYGNKFENRVASVVKRDDHLEKVRLARNELDDDVIFSEIESDDEDF